MEVTPSGLLLIDKSAWERVDALEHIDGEPELCVCDITRLEVLHSVRDFAEYEHAEQHLDRLRPLVSNAETWAIARTAHRELAAVGRHRISLPDLLIASCAQQHGADVLHVDRHFDLLASVLVFKSVRLR